jgi:Ulp1 family protease
LLWFSPKTIAAQIHPLQLSSYSLVFFPVPTAERRKNKHWSLLIWRPKHRRGTPAFYHFDSCGNVNSRSATKLAASLAALFNLPSTRLSHGTAPRQMNQYDCGLYVMAMEEYISAGLSPGPDMRALITSDFVEEFRRRLQVAIRTYTRNPTYGQIPVDGAATSLLC